MSQGSTERRTEYYGPIVFLAALALYAPTLGYDFAYDDYLQIVNNPVVTSASRDVVGLLDPFLKPTYPGDLYRPFTVFTYRLHFLSGDLNPFPYHLVNVLLHAFVSLLLFVLYRGWSGRPKHAFAAALLFALHPIHVEAVANVSGRAELLAGAFCLGALWAFGRAAGLEGIGRRASMLSLSALLFLLAVSSKESSLTLLLILPFVFRRAPRRLVLGGAAVLCVSGAVMLLMRRLVLQDLFYMERDGVNFYVENALLNEPLARRIWPGIKIFGDYLALLVSPIRLSADYSQTHEQFWSEVFSTRGTASAMLALLFAGLLWRLRKRDWSVWGLWTILTFAMTSNIVMPIGTIKGERLAYLPSAGFCVFAVEWIGSYLGRRTAAAALLLLGGAFGLRSAIRLPDWRDSEAIFTGTVRDDPANPKANMSLAKYLYHYRLDRDRAEIYFRHAIRIDPGNLNAAKYLIDIMLARKEWARAEYWCRKGLEISPDDPTLQAKLGQLMEFKHSLRPREPG